MLIGEGLEYLEFAIARNKTAPVKEKPDDRGVVIYPLWTYNQEPGCVGWMHRITFPTSATTKHYKTLQKFILRPFYC